MKVFKTLLGPILILLCIVIILGNVINVLGIQQGKYLSSNYWKNFPELERTYRSSQYVNKHPTGWIPDETVNAYAGGAYIRGVSPILIAPDTPPLGRYLIGISALLFNNENVITLVSTCGSLLVMYLIGMQIFKRHLLALLPPTFLSFEPLFLNQLIYTPLLDTIQLFFLLLGFYFFNLSLLLQRKKIIYFILANIFLGCFIATKFYITGITVVAAWIITLLILRKPNDLLLYLITLPTAGFVLLASYIRVLFDHYSLLKFLGIQKYVFLYHKSQLIYPFSIWALLLFNKWYVWFGNNPVISDAQWRITWPLLTIGTCLTGVLLTINKIKVSLPVIPLLFWVISYLLFFSVGQVASRYFVILLPVMYIIVIYTLFCIFPLLPTIKKRMQTSFVLRKKVVPYKKQNSNKRIIR